MKEEVLRSAKCFFLFSHLSSFIIHHFFLSLASTATAGRLQTSPMTNHAATFRFLSRAIDAHISADATAETISMTGHVILSIAGNSCIREHRGQPYCLYYLFLVPMIKGKVGKE